MKLLRLYALNFKRIKFDRPLEFRDGLTLISGLNETGKSSILDAILYALFGRVIRPPGRTKNEDILAYNANEAIVWLEFEIEGRRYRVTRTIHRTKPSKANLDEILADGHLRPLATEVKGVTEGVISLLGGITFNEIVSSNVVAQKDLSRLIQQRGDDRRKIINVFLNLDSFNTVLDSLNEERKNLEGTGLARPGKINIEKEKLVTLQQELQEFRRRQQEIRDLEEENQALSPQLETLQVKYDAATKLHDLLSRYDDAVQRRAEIQRQIDLRQQALETHRREVATLEDQIVGVTRQLHDYSGLDELERSLAQAQVKIEEIKTLNIKLQEQQARQRILEDELTTLKSELGDFDPEHLKRLRQGSHKIKLLGAGTGLAVVLAFLALLFDVLLLAIALAALGGVLASLLTVKVARMSRLTELEGLMAKSELLGEKRKNLDEIVKSVELLGSQRIMLENQVAEICGGIPRYAHIYQAYRQAGIIVAAETVIEKVREERKTSDDLSTRLKTLREQLERVKGGVDIRSAQTEIENLKQQLSSILLPKLPEGIEFSRELLRKVGQEKENLAREISSKKTRIDSNNKAIEADQKYVAEHLDIEEKVQNEKKVIEEIEWRIRVVRKSIEAVEKTAEALRNRVKPGVENYMSHILPLITSGRYKAVRLDEDYNLEVWDPEAGEFRAKEVFSGGTEDQLLLAMRLAFALALLPEVKGKTPEFLFLDEPLSSSDEVRRTGILEYLSSGLAGSFKQVFLISHVGGLEERATNIIWLEDGRLV